MIGLNEIVELLRHGTCPHTGKPYDCARCEWKEPPMRVGVSYCVHFAACITHPIDGRGWKDLLRNFDREDRPEAQRLLSEALQLGATCIPIGDCDAAHFCFKHGCVGHHDGEEARK